MLPKEKLVRPKLCFESNFDWLVEQITDVKVSRDKHRFLKEYWNDPKVTSLPQEAKNMYQDLLVAFKVTLKTRENLLLSAIRLIVVV